MRPITPALFTTLLLAGCSAPAPGQPAEPPPRAGFRLLQVPEPPAALLARWVGRAIAVRLPAEAGQPARIVPATLLSAAHGGVVRIDGQIYLKTPGELIVPDLPPGTAATPTLEWRPKATPG